MKRGMKLFAIWLAFAAFGLHADWTIVLAEKPAPAEITAAEELQSALLKIFDKKLPIVRGNAPSPAVRIGATQENARLLGIDITELGPDEIILKSIGEDLILAGAPPRGSLYAVYEYLERYFGVRFWTAFETYYPKKETFALPPVDYRYAPVFHLREAYYDIIRENPGFAAKMRNNWHSTLISVQWGGHEQLMGGIHTFEKFVPAKKFFESNPEYFGMMDGKRHPDTQPCLTNPGFREELTKETLKRLRANPKIKTIMVSQNDNLFYCQCPECEKFVAEHGNQTDLMLDAVNYVADAVKAEFPDKKIMTIAYQYTEALPRKIRPRENIVINLCTSECDFSKGLDDEKYNQKFSEAVRGWAGIAHELNIWNYVTNFHGFHFPFPNWKHLASDIRFFAANKTRGLFEQGSLGAGYAGDLVPLRIYLISKLMWNPTLDQQAVTDEFLNGYYGKAASAVRQYMAMMTDAMERNRSTGQGLSCNMHNVSWLDDATLLKALKVMEEAQRSCANDPALQKKIMIATIPLNIALLQRRNLFEKHKNTDPMAFFDEQLKLCQEAGATRFGESNRFYSFEAVKTRFCMQYAHTGQGAIPGCVGKDAEWSAFPAEEYATLYKEGRWTFRKPDPAAANGKAIMMPQTHNQWAVQLLNYPNDTDYEVYVSVRCDEMNDSKPVLILGAHDPQEPSANLRVRVNGNAISGKEYKCVKLGTLKAGSTALLFAAPAKRNTEQSVWIDRFIFVKK